MAPLKQVRLEGKVGVPHLIYGTAFKNSATADHVHEAWQAGFRAFDSAPQTRYYMEELVGEGLRRARGLPPRDPLTPLEPLYLQTKFTSAAGYDVDMPYSFADSPATQVNKSIQSSIRNLGCGLRRVDSFLLHAPLATLEETMLYWHAAEAQVPEHVRY